MENKSNIPNLGQKQIAQQIDHSISTSMRFGDQINMSDPHFRKKDKLKNLTSHKTC